ncbi:hypothetical protein CC2G_000476 [Coprinopsis cinerea AmutBmut pab1-1]|nr:hypothetical protein CC2G_000476 [Coprinopsis cinerea AmutBmut pab1-1]
MVTSAPYILASAFSTKHFDGNPAAIVFIDTDVDLSILRGLSKNFNQPMGTFVKPPVQPAKGEKVVSTEIRYVTTTGLEAPVCGHATLAASKAILSLPGFSDAGIQECRFRTRTAGVISVKVLDDGFFELELPSACPEEVSREEIGRITAIVRRAFKRDLNVVGVRHGGAKYPHILMIEIEEDENLAEAVVNVGVFSETGYGINAVTSIAAKSVSDAGEQYTCRMFSPELPGGEDPVCGSMQCVLAPYWYTKKNIPSGTRIVSRQVSPRGGVVHIVWDQTDGVIKLRGAGRVLAQGQCFY